MAAIDYGEKRIGIAISDPERRIASPLATYERRDAAADARYFRNLVQQERIAGFVVGLPLHLSGDESPTSQKARRFGAWLQEQTACPVCFLDERFTTSVAHDVLQEAGQRPRGKRRGLLDRLAAQAILAAFLDRGGMPEDEPSRSAT